MCESFVKLNFNFYDIDFLSKNPSSPFPGTLSSASSVPTHSTPNLMDELRIHFGSMVIIPNSLLIFILLRTPSTTYV